MDIDGSLRGTSRARADRARDALLRILVIVASLALAAVALGGPDDGDPAGAGGEADDVVVRFHGDLPSRGGEVLGEASVASLEEQGVADEMADARYVVLEVGGRAYAFPLHAASMAEGELRLSIRGHDTEGISTVPTNAGTAGHAPLRPVAETLAAGVAGRRDLILAARRDGDAHVVTYLAPRADVTGASTIDAREDEGYVVVLLQDGRSTIHEVVGEADTFGGLTVRTEDGTRGVSDPALWEAPEDAASDASGDLRAGIGLPLGE